MARLFLICAFTGGCVVAIWTASSAQEAKTFSADVVKPARVYVGGGAGGGGVLTTKPMMRQIEVRHTIDRDEHRFAGQVEEGLAEWKAAKDDAAREAATKKMRDGLNEIFAIRQKAHEQEIADLEQKVKELREQLDRRKEKQEDIISFRLEQLTREAQGLGWGTDSPPGKNFYLFNKVMEEGTSLPTLPDPVAVPLPPVGPTIVR